MDNQTEISKAVNVLIEELLKDKSEGSYYYSWQANIAMAFQDIYNGSNDDILPNHLHERSNQAAKNFLDMLCKKSEPQTPPNNNE